jgi:hypothetical protein
VFLDLDGNGVTYANKVMDVNSDGVIDYTSWVSAEDGVLVWNSYGDGLVHDESQYTFSHFDGMTDMARLSNGFDTNGDGKLDQADERYGELMVWQDANNDGVSQAGEMMSLIDLQIVSIGLVSQGSSSSPSDGVTVFGMTSATKTDGTTLDVTDVLVNYTAATAEQVAAYHHALTGSFKLDGLCTVLNLETLVSKLGVTEKIDLTGSGNDTLKLSLADVMAVSETPDLFVTGNAGDIVQIIGTTVTPTLATVGGIAYNVYSLDSTHQLYLQQGVTAVLG